MRPGTGGPEAIFAAEDIASIRRTRPVVHCITNPVSMNLVANAVLAVGGSPVMASAVEEVEEITAGASALLLNTGTLNSAKVEAMKLAASVAAESGIPVIIDPVGAGASAYRRSAVLELLDTAKPSAIRANPSEILALSGSHRGAGIDSVHEPEEAVEAAGKLARIWKCPVVVSGKADYVVSKGRTVCVLNGSEIMRHVTGIGCAATALVATFSACCPDRFRAAAGAVITAGVAGELASAETRGPGSFQAAFLDALFRLDAGLIESRVRIKQI